MKKKFYNKYFKFIIICLISSVGMLAFLYLIGVIHQVFANYFEWNAKGGFLNDELIRPVNWNMVVCIGNALSWGGLKLMLILALVIGGVILYFKYRDKFNGKKRDPRGFIISKDATHGTAALMDEKELKTILCKGPTEDADGKILGKKDGKTVWLPKDTRLNGHVAIFGSSGSMKSRAIIRNALFQVIKSGESVVVTDLKGELYEDTAQLFEDSGYKIRVLNLMHPERSDTWNCLATVQDDLDMIHTISSVIMQNTRRSGKIDQFWEAAEENLLNALLLYICNDESRTPDEKNMCAVYDLLVHASEAELMQMFEMYRKKSGNNDAFEIYKKSVEKVRSGALTGLGARLGIWQAKEIKRMTSASDIDLTALAKEKCVYFVRMQEFGSSYAVLSSLFFSCLFLELGKYIAEQPINSTLPVNFILDEFNNIGQIGGNGGLDFAQTISTCRSKKISVMIASQGLPQLQNRYPNEIWAEILGNCDIQLLLGCNDLITSKYFSESAGKMSVESDGYMTNRKAFASAQVAPEYRQTQNTIERDVLTPDEVRRLPWKRLLCLIRGQNALILDKLDYIEHPFAKRIQKKDLNSYVPIRGLEKSKIELETTCGYTELAERKISCIGSKPPEDF